MPRSKKKTCDCQYLSAAMRKAGAKCNDCCGYSKVCQLPVLVTEKKQGKRRKAKVGTMTVISSVPLRPAGASLAPKKKIAKKAAPKKRVTKKKAAAPKKKAAAPKQKKTAKKKTTRKKPFTRSKYLAGQICPRCLTKNILYIVFVNADGAYHHAKYICQYWEGLRADKPCGWSGWSIPNLVAGDGPEDDELVTWVHR